MQKSIVHKKTPLPMKFLLGFVVFLVIFRILGLYSYHSVRGLAFHLTPLMFFDIRYPMTITSIGLVASGYAGVMAPLFLTVYEDRLKKTRTGAEKGSSAWTQTGESSKYIDPDSFYNNQIFTKTEFFSRNMRITGRNRNILLLGRPGTGKSRYFFKPNILQHLDGSVAVTDPKGELLRDCGHALKEAGYTIKVLNLSEMWQSNHYNPFQYLKFVNEDTKEVKVNLTDKELNSGKWKLVDADVLQLIASIMMNTNGEGEEKKKGSSDPFWDKAEELYLQSIMYYIIYNLPKRFHNFATLLELMRLSECEEGEVSQLDMMFDEWEYGKRANVPQFDIGDRPVLHQGRRAVYGQSPEDIARMQKEWDRKNEERQKWMKENNCYMTQDGVIRYKEWKDRYGNIRHPERTDNIGLKQWHHFKSGVQSEKTMATIMLTAAARLAPLNIPEVYNFINDDDMELNRCGTPLELDINNNEIPNSGGRIIWFIVTKPNEQKFNFIANMFYTQLFQIIDLTAGKYNGSCPVPVDLYMDEWAQIGEIPRFVETLAYVRGFNCGIVVGLQSLDQLKKFYQNSWETVLDCCDFILYLGSTAKSTLEYFVTLIGDETIRSQTQSRSYGRSGSSSHNWGIDARKLIDIAELRTIGKENCILMDMNEVNGVAYYSKLYDLAEHPRYSLLYEPWAGDDNPENAHKKYNHMDALNEEASIKKMKEFYKQFGLSKSLKMVKEVYYTGDDWEPVGSSSLLTPEEFKNS